MSWEFWWARMESNHRPPACEEIWMSWFRSNIFEIGVSASSKPCLAVRCYEHTALRFAEKPCGHHSAENPLRGVELDV
jgi:hypothetical protein